MSDEAGEVAEITTVIGLGLGCLLVSKEPSMRVRGVNNIQVSPNKRTRRSSDRSSWERPLSMRVAMVVPASEGIADVKGEEEGEDDAELHHPELEEEKSRGQKEAAPTRLSQPTTARLIYLHIHTICTSEREPSQPLASHF